MIHWTTQNKLITDIFYSFQQGVKTHLPLSTNLEREKMFLRPEKLETQTLSNFKIILLDIMFNNNFSSKIKFMEKLNSLSKQDIKDSGQLRSDLLSFTFILNKDENTMKTLNISPYEAYQKKMIHKFYLANYYNNSNEIKGRVMTKEINNAKVLISFFNIKTN